MGCISLLGGVHFVFPGVQMGCNPEMRWGANHSPGVHSDLNADNPYFIA